MTSLLVQGAAGRSARLSEQHRAFKARDEADARDLLPSACQLPSLRSLALGSLTELLRELMPANRDIQELIDAGAPVNCADS